MHRLVQKIGDQQVHVAGWPRFLANFSRDSFLAAIIANDLELLKEQIVFATSHQAKGYDVLTGAESGKIHHEIPGVSTRLGLYTTFNACETTALFLIALELFAKYGREESLLLSLRPKVEAAVGYIQRHLRDGLFAESPSFCGAEHFAAKVTYWKDSVLPAEREEPSYPVVYSLAHFQNARGLKAAGYLLRDDGLTRQAALMVEAGLSILWQERRGFVIAHDQRGEISGPSSDTLHILAYLPAGSSWLDEARKKVFRTVARELESCAGFRSLTNKLGQTMADTYHGPSTVWPFEQVFIEAGSRKFGLELSTVAARILAFLDDAPEYLICDGGRRARGAGCDPQLWTLAAKRYFEARRRGAGALLVEAL